jgi:hypothetical protein
MQSISLVRWLDTQQHSAKKKKKKKKKKRGWWTTWSVSLETSWTARLIFWSLVVCWLGCGFFFY